MQQERASANESRRKPFLGPIYAFLSAESAGGLVLLTTTVLALVWANSRWSDSYEHLWGLQLALSLGSWTWGMSLHHWVNDGLMAIFFLLAGLEIKRELVLGELATVHRAALPVAAAIGGMVVPALIYTAINARGPGAPGWGIPMATDIAFAVGVVAIFGRHVPISVRVLLLAIAIVDDLGASVVIAMFYTRAIHLQALAIAAAFFAGLVLLNLRRVHRSLPYVLLGIGLWAATLGSGIHATVAGVLLAMTIPARRQIEEQPYVASARKIIRIFALEAAAEPTKITPTQSHAIESLDAASRAVQTLLARIEHALLRPVNFAIVPLFALANAGLDLRNGTAGAAVSPIAWGVLLGLVTGKPAGILLASWAAIKTRTATMPEGATPRQIVGIALICGIGFTMSLFVANLAFPDRPAELSAAKIGVLAASVCSGIVGALVIARPSSAKVT